MLKVIKNRIEQGNKTSKYPKEPISLYKRFRGRPEINRSCSSDVVRTCAEICPQDAILEEEKKIDIGRCTFCGQCECVENGAFVKFSQDFELGAAHRKIFSLTENCRISPIMQKNISRNFSASRYSSGRFLLPDAIPVKRTQTF